jgi:hypothetical protein
MFGLGRKKRLAAEQSATQAYGFQTNVPRTNPRPVYIPPPLEHLQPEVSPRLRAKNPVVFSWDRTGMPAATISLGKLGQSTDRRDIDLRKLVDIAGISLRKGGASGIRGKKVTLVDRSGSMVDHFESGVVQTLIERDLAFGLQMATDGTVTVIPFDTKVWPAAVVNVTNYREVVSEKIWRRGQKMGWTNLADALRVVLEMAKTTTELIVVTIITDGIPYLGRYSAIDPEEDALDVICELSQYPVILKFMAIDEVPFLVKVDEDDDLPRLYDNANSQFFNGRHGDREAKPNWRPRITDPACTHEVFADAETAELPEIIARAQSFGVLLPG